MSDNYKLIIQAKWQTRAVYMLELIDNIQYLFRIYRGISASLVNLVNTCTMQVTQQCKVTEMSLCIWIMLQIIIVTVLSFPKMINITRLSTADTTTRPAKLLVSNRWQHQFSIFMLSYVFIIRLTAFPWCAQMKTLEIRDLDLRRICSGIPP